MPEIGARKVVSRTSWRALLTESWASRRFASAVGRLTAAPPLAAPVSAPALSALLEASEPLPEAPDGAVPSEPLDSFGSSFVRRRSPSPIRGSTVLPRAGPSSFLRDFDRRRFAFHGRRRGPVLRHQPDELGRRAALVGGFLAFGFRFFFFGFGGRFDRFFGFDQLRLGGGEGGTGRARVDFGEDLSLLDLLPRPHLDRGHFARGAEAQFDLLGRFERAVAGDRRLDDPLADGRGALRRRRAARGGAPERGDRDRDQGDRDDREADLERTAGQRPPRAAGPAAWAGTSEARSGRHPRDAAPRGSALSNRSLGLR